MALPGRAAGAHPGRCMASPSRWRVGRLVFLYYFTHISGPFEEAVGLLSDSPGRWLSKDLTAACDDVAAITPQEPVGGEVDPQACLEISVGPPSRSPGSAVLPLRVGAPCTGAPFVRLEADLQLAELSVDRVQLTLRGSYRARANSGIGSDPAHAHRLAEAVARAFVERVADRLNVHSRAGSPGGPLG